MNTSLRLLALTVLLTAASCSRSHAPTASHSAWNPPAIPAPAIPNHTYNVRDFASSPSPIQQAIDAAGKTSGGTVIVPAGDHVTGPLKLVSNLHLHLEKGAVVRFTDDPTAYPVGTFTSLPDRHCPLIGAENLHDLLITGPGTLDGQGARWWADFRAHKSDAGFVERRPKFLCFESCQRLTIRDLTIINGPMFHMSPTHSEDVLVERVTVKAPSNAPNTDSFNPSGWNIVVRNCDFDIGDDNIAVKPFHKPAPRFPGDDRLSVENLYIHDCTFRHGHGLSVGGQTPGGLRNMHVRNITFIGTDIGLRLKAERGDGGLVENVTYENITMTDVKSPLVITSYYHGLPKPGAPHETKPVDARTPIWRDIQITNVKATGAKEAGLLMGLPEMPIENLSLSNVTIEAKEPLRIGNTVASRFTNVQVLTPASTPPLLIEQGVAVQGLPGHEILPPGAKQTASAK